MCLKVILLNSANLEITWGKKGMKSHICIMLDSLQTFVHCLNLPCVMSMYYYLYFIVRKLNL